MVIKQGIPSVRSSKSIPATAFIIKKPTKIKAGAVAALGTKRKRGLRKRARINRTAVTMDERPVLPPAATPEELSTKLVTVDVPNAAPATVPIASARRACFTFGMFPSLSVNPASVVTPTSVPIVSKISTKRNVKNTVKNFKVRTCEKSNFQNKGASGRETA